VSERRAGPENINAEADPAILRGRLLFVGEASEKRNQQFRRGIGDGMYERGKQTQHGKPHYVVEREINRTPARDRSGVMGWRRGP